MALVCVALGCVPLVDDMLPSDHGDSASTEGDGDGDPGDGDGDGDPGDGDGESGRW